MIHRLAKARGNHSHGVFRLVWLFIHLETGSSLRIFAGLSTTHKQEGGQLGMNTLITIVSLLGAAEVSLRRSQN
jgi:hypothetical protein